MYSYLRSCDQKLACVAEAAAVFCGQDQWGQSRREGPVTQGQGQTHACTRPSPRHSRTEVKGFKRQASFVDTPGSLRSLPATRHCWDHEAGPGDGER